MVRPLTKRKGDDVLYARPPKIEAEIGTVSELSPEVLQERLNITKPETSGYISSECLIYLIREASRSNDENRRDTVLPVLLSRCKAILILKAAARKIPDAESFCEEIHGRFSEMLAEDMAGENADRLDFYEIRFNLAFRCFYLDAFEKEEKYLRNTVPLPEATAEDGLEEHKDASAWVPEALQAGETPEDVAFRDELVQAIKSLPLDEQQVVILHFMEHKVESKDPREVTIATLCRCSGRTVRNRHSRAAAKLQRFKKEAP